LQYNILYNMLFKPSQGGAAQYNYIYIIIMKHLFNMTSSLLFPQHQTDHVIGLK